MKKFLCIDIETTGLDVFKDRLHGIGIGWGEDQTKYFPAWNPFPPKLLKALANPKLPKVGHNLRNFDLRFLHFQGIEVAGPIYDTMNLAQILDENQPLGLKPLSEKYLGIDSIEAKKRLDKAIAESGAKNIAAFNALDLNDPQHPYSEIIATYCCEDTNNSFKLLHVLWRKLKETSEKLRVMGFKKTPCDYFIEETVPTETMLFQMEMQGIRINMNEIEKVKNNALNRKRRLEKWLDRHAPEVAEIETALYEKECAKKVTAKGKARVARDEKRFSWGNGNHLATLVYSKLNVPRELVVRTRTGKWDTSEAQLATLTQELPVQHRAVPLLKVYARYKKILKTVSTYTGTDKKGLISKIQTIDGIPKIFAQYPQLTQTGRLSSKEPNMQNLKRGSPVKRFFVPSDEDSVFVHLDYSQVELRLAAHLSQDQKLVEAYKAGADLHRQTAAKMFETVKCGLSDDEKRQVGKTSNFLLIYDGKGFRLQESIYEATKIEFSLAECNVFRNAFFEHFHEYKDYLGSQKTFVERMKFVIAENGRIRRLPDIKYGRGVVWEKSKTEPGKRDPYFKGDKADRTVLYLELCQVKANEWKQRRLKGQPPAPSEEELGWFAYRKFSHALKQAYNFPVQGMGATLAKRAMVELWKRGFKVVSQVHDSIDVELKKSELHKVPEIVAVMEGIYPLTVPLKVDTKILLSFDESDKLDTIVSP